MSRNSASTFSRSAYAHQNRASSLRVQILGQPARALRQKQHTCTQDDAGDGRQSQHPAPSPAFRIGEIDKVGAEDADGNRQLEE